jgi:hypothetical protein
MAYWKRQYTERSAGKPLFRPEPKSANPPEQPRRGEPTEGPDAEPKPPDEETTRARPPGQ